MAFQHPLITFNRRSGLETYLHGMEMTCHPETFDIDGFRDWMLANEASPETTCIYCRLLERWENHMQTNGASNNEAWSR